MEDRRELKDAQGNLVNFKTGVSSTDQPNNI
jgi:hypothetical protein